VPRVRATVVPVTIIVSGQTYLFGNTRPVEVSPEHLKDLTRNPEIEEVI